MSSTDPRAPERLNPNLTLTGGWPTSTGDNYRGHVNGGASTLTVEYLRRRYHEPRK